MEISIKFDREHLNYHEDSGKVYFTYDTIRQAPEWPEIPLIEIIHGDLFMVPGSSIQRKKRCWYIFSTILHMHSRNGEPHHVFTLL